MPGGLKAITYAKSVEYSPKRNGDIILRDLLVSSITRQSLLALSSDYELCQEFKLFTDMLRADALCHEAMFGLGRINYVQGRYEIAEKWFIKSYETH